jgi:hypothetical protein
MAPQSELAADVLDGAAAIADYTGLPRARVNRWLVLGVLPARKLMGKWIGRKSELREALRGQIKPQAAPKTKSLRRRRARRAVRVQQVAAE